MSERKRDGMRENERKRERKTYVFLYIRD